MISPACSTFTRRCAKRSKSSHWHLQKTLQDSVVVPTSELTTDHSGAGAPKERRSDNRGPVMKRGGTPFGCPPKSSVNSMTKELCLISTIEREKCHDNAR